MFPNECFKSLTLLAAIKAHQWCDTMFGTGGRILQFQLVRFYRPLSSVLKLGIWILASEIQSLNHSIGRLGWNHFIEMVSWLLTCSLKIEVSIDPTGSPMADYLLRWQSASCILDNGRPWLADCRSHGLSSEMHDRISVYPISCCYLNNLRIVSCNESLVRLENENDTVAGSFSSKSGCRLQAAPLPLASELQVSCSARTCG